MRSGQPPATVPALFGNASPETPEADSGGKEENISGEILRIVFGSEDGQYVVLRLLDANFQEQTLVGPLGGVLEGQDIEAWGRWETHKQHGRQFRVSRFRALLPSSAKGVRRYLASGIIPGIGPKLAERIVDRFGEKTLEVLDKYSVRLREVPGIGRKRIDQIREAWRRHAEERSVRIFLQGLGMGPSTTTRVLQRYGQGAAEVVRRNPYVLAREVRGIGFSTADRIAGQLGIEPTSPLRLAAGVVYVLQQLGDRGHTCYPQSQLLEEVARTLDVDEDHVRIGLERALVDGTVRAESEVVGGSDPYLYLHHLHAAESELAAALGALLDGPAPAPQSPPRFGGPLWERLNAEQKQAVARAFTAPVSLITGGPGVGKTTVVGQIVTEARRCGLRVLLAAPTGRAAKRLAESCRREARTLHRLLKWDPKHRTFVHNADRPLRCDLLIVDEVSMLDVVLANHLFAAIAPGTRVVMVGDKDQLPSVGPGFLLHDLIDCGRVPVTYLTHIYRQQENSRIVWNAHLVNRGEMPDLRRPPLGELRDFYWIDEGDPDRVMALIARMASERIPRSFRFDPRSDVQVLVPMHRGSCGASALNALLQQALNPNGSPAFRYGERVFRVGDRVMQITNNYDKGVFNGELGQIAGIDGTAKTFRVAFDIGVVDYGWDEADQVKLAYAVTIHKSQGSEFPVVIMPVLTQHFIMLQRNLVYTGMTRARRLLVMIGTRKALAIAIRNDRPAFRCSLLAARLGASRLPRPHAE